MEDFRADLDHIIDEALSRGAEPLELDAVASERLANYYSSKLRIYADLFIKCFLVVSCSAAAVTIYLLKAWAEWTGHKIPDDQWLNWISGICVLAAAAHFFPVERMVKLFRCNTWSIEYFCGKLGCKNRVRDKDAK